MAEVNNEMAMVEVGARVVCRNEHGTVRFKGQVLQTKGLWLGVEWDNPERGLHDGSHEGKQYFKCTHPTGGSFVRLNKVNFGINFLLALEEQYSSNVQLDNDSLPVWKGHKKPVILVGMEKVLQKQSQFEKLLRVSFPEHYVSSADPEGEIRATCPNIKELCLTKQLLSTWDDVAKITIELSHLHHLNLSENRLRVPDNPSVLANAFSNLRLLILNKCAISWPQILQCASMWPVLEELNIHCNGISTLSRPEGVLLTLKRLMLEDNNLTSNDDLLHLSHLPCLEVLNLDNNRLTDIMFPDVVAGQKTSMFKQLKQLIISNNLISNWKSVDELEKLPCLTELKITFNPVIEKEQDSGTAQQMVVARVGGLQTLNFMPVSKKERSQAEWVYVRRFGVEWQKAGGREEKGPSEEFLQLHPRYQQLIEKFGAPEESELQPSTHIMKVDLLPLNILCPDHPKRKPIKKTFPSAMSLHKVKSFLAHLLKIKGCELNLSYMTQEGSREYHMPNDVNPLHFYAIAPGDSLLVRW
uniref:Tubulin-specific chaperone E n=1 Tax=Eptatretus burgeri TaxID=7764 RepID=A0A8C4NBZ3_EPTBU